MRYREFRPVAALRPYVRCFWYLDRTYAADQPPELVWPNASVEVIVHFADRYLEPGRRSARLPHAFVIGPLTRYVALSSPGRVTLVGARCYPWGFARLFGGPLRELRDLVQPFTDFVAASTVARLEERMCEAPPHVAVSYLSDLLVSRLRQTDAETADVVSLLGRRLLSRRRSALTLAADATLSLRQLERHFDDRVGVSPKQLIRIVRFNAARQALVADPFRDVLDVAFASGYTDYSHMTRDFRQFLGLTPARLRSWAQAMRSEATDVAFLHEPATG